MAFLLALALVVSVMSGLGLSVSAEQESNTPGTEEVQQQDKTEAGAAPSEGKAEEEAAKPEGKPVQEEKADEQKKQEETKTDDAAKDDANAQDGDQKDEPQAEPAAEEPAEPVEQASVPIVQAAAGEVSQYTITCGNQSLTVQLFDTDGNKLTGIKPNDLEIQENAPVSVNDYAAKVDGYSFSYAYYGNDNSVSTIAYYNNYRKSGREYTWYSVDQSFLSTTRNKITNDTLYLVYEKKPGFFTIHYVDENGNQIAPSEMKEDTSGEVTFANYKKNIDGYTYWRACYSTANNAEITKAVKSTNYWGSDTYTFYNGSTALTQGYGDESINELKDIYLVYVKNGVAPTPGGTAGGSGSSIGEPSHTKKAWLQDDGTYDLSLDVSASVGTATSKAILDVVFILDTSGSMKDPISESDQKTKIESATDAIKAMVNSLAANGKIDAQFSLITFANQAKTVQEWTPSADTLNGSLPKKADGGTNYQDAFIKGKALLGSSRTNATRVVVFVSDGNPTYYMSATNTSKVKGTGNSDTTGRGMSNARGVVKTMLPNYLFTVGVGDPDEYSKLSQITDAAHPGVKIENYEGTNTNTLKAAFNDMEGQITSIACKDVTISDKLSTNVAMVMADGKPKKLKGEVTDKNGKLVGTYNSADGSITLPATELNGETILPKPTYKNEEIVWNLPDGYKLEAGYTYTVTANVDVTETAFANYREGNKYPDTPDAGTGTHADKKEDGLFSNDNPNAKLTYTVTGESKSKDVLYQKPVVRLTPSTLTIKKTVTGLDKTALEKLKNSLKFKVTYTYKDKTTTEKEISFKDFTLSDGTYSYTSDTLDCWSMDATYTVVEEDFAVEGYDRTNSATTVTGDFKGKNQNEIASFTNTYTPSNRTITLKKVVGGNMGDTNKEFQFNVSGNATMSGNGKLKDNGETTITAKVGETVTITEDDYTSDGYTTTATATEGVNGEYKDHSYTFTVTKDMSASTIITFTNTKTIQPPNGITTTIAPYAIMVVLAAGAGVYFVYSRRRRNR